MGAQWKHAGRLESSHKRGALIGKLVKEIIVATRCGAPSPEHNARLRAAIEAAKKASVPRDNIERAIKKGSGQTGEIFHFETILYEGFTPHQIPVLVECVTDNKHRTVADIRLLFRKGTLGSAGSVSWMFERMGVLEAFHANKEIDLEAIAIEVGAEQVEFCPPSGARFYSRLEDLERVQEQLTLQQWEVTQAEPGYFCKNPKSLPDPLQHAEVVDFLNALDQHDDVHRLYVGLE